MGIPRKGKKSFSTVQLPDTGTLSTVLKRLEREVHHLPLFRVEVKKGVEVYLHFLLPYTSTYVLRCLAGEKLSLSTSDVGKVELKLFILHTLRIGITFLEFLIRVYAVCITNSILYFSSDTTRL